MTKNEQFNPEGDTSEFQFFQIGPMMEGYRKKFEYPESLGDLTLGFLGVERPE